MKWSNRSIEAKVQRIVRMAGPDIRAGHHVIEGNRNVEVRLPPAAGERFVRSLTDAGPTSILTPMTILPGLAARAR